MIEQVPLRVNDNSHYKNKNYYLRHIKGTLDKIVYRNVEDEIEQAGI